MIKLIIPLFLTSLPALADSKDAIREEIRASALEYGIDPDFAEALATVESNLNPRAVGSLGEIGLFQLRPEFHDVKPGERAHNTALAMRYLRQLKTRFEPRLGSGWFVAYNFGPSRVPSKPQETAYYKKVSREMKRIRQERQIAYGW